MQKIFVALLGISVLTSACAEPTEPVTASSVAVTAASTVLASGATLQLVAIALDKKGSPLPGQPINWTSSNSDVATVSSSGIVTAGRNLGSTNQSVTIAALSGSVSGSVTIFVIPVPVAAVIVAPGAATISVGGTQQLTATPQEATGLALTGRTLNWSSSDTTVATVTATGMVSAKVYTGPAIRTATLTATSEGQSGRAVISVSPASVATVSVAPGTATIAVGETEQLTATPKDAIGTALTGRAFSWSSSDTTVANVDMNGLVTAKAYAGSATRAATFTVISEGKSGTATVHVTPAPVATVEVTPGAATVVAGGSQQLTATTQDATGTALNGRTVSWNSSDTTVAIVTATGMVTAKAYAGAATRTARLTAASEGKIGTATLTVTPTPVATLEITPGTAALAVGDTLQLLVTPKDAAGVTLVGRLVEWISSDSTVAIVSPAATVTAVGSGAATLTAVSEGITTAMNLRIRPAFASYVELDGENDAILGQRPFFTNPQAEFTIEMWVRTADSLQTDGNLFVKNGDLEADISFFYRAGRLVAQYADFQYGVFRVETDSAVNLTEWSHVAWVKTLGEQSLYVNGKRVATAATNVRPFVRWDRVVPPGNPPFSIGGSNYVSNGNGYLRFDVARVRVSSTARYQQEFVPLDFLNGDSVLLYRLDLAFVDPFGTNGTLYGGVWHP